MALISRIFFRRNNKQIPSLEGPCTESKPLPFTFDKNEVRILLFRECDWRGRKLLFDSSLVEKVPLDPDIPSRCHSNSTDALVEVSKTFGYKYKKPHADTNNLGEAVFGSIAMASKGTNIKVHSMKEPARLMFTKVIQAPRSRVRRRNCSDDKILNDSQGSSISSIGEYNSSGSFSSKRGSLDTTAEDSGFGGVTDLLIPPSCPSGCPLHTPCFTGTSPNSSSSLQSDSSLSSLRRRWARSVATSLNFTDPSELNHTSGKRTKLGISIIVPLAPPNTQEMEQFLLQRLTLMHTILTRLQHSTEQAYCRREVFVQSMVQASNLAKQSIWELVEGPRLDKPRWLTLTSDLTDPGSKDDLATSLVSDLTQLLGSLDTKNTNFFISTLLTAVLTQHLGWVPSVFTPTRSDAMLSEMSRSHPYNPLWAQQSDLQGAMGYPPRTAKTVVVGKSHALVQQLVSVLSYFIRCGRVTAVNPEPELTGDDDDSHLERFLEQGLSFDKDAIREFSQAGSVEDTNSTATLTKSRTVLSMKTFSQKDCNFDNSNSLESGFESSNDVSGESYDEEKICPKNICRLACSQNFGKIDSCARLIETSFSENTVTEFKHSPSPLDPLNRLSRLTVLETNHKNIVKVENEKQFSSTETHNTFERINSITLYNNYNNEVDNCISRNNLFQSIESNLDEKGNSRVVFLLGENEELVNIKSQDESKAAEQNFKPENNQNCEPPITLITDDNLDNDLNDDLDKCSDCGEGNKTGEKTGFITGKVKGRVLIVRSTPIEMEGSTSPRLLQTHKLHRCLSVPEEAVSETSWLKMKRSREAVRIIRRWLSDSAIEKTLRKPECELNSFGTTELSNLSALPDHIFRTSNRSLKYSCDRESTLQLVNKISNVPEIRVKDMEKSISPAGLYSPIELPLQRCVEETAEGTVVEVANSLLGGVGDTFRPLLTLQGVTQPSQDWLHDLHHSLTVDAQVTDTEAVCVLANTDTWEVLLVSSQSTTSLGVGVGMSQLVANMLETTLYLYNMTQSPHLCLSHMEAKLLELCVRSQALAELLLNSDFMDIATLTSELDLDANDVPLLLSVASTHSPQVTRKYGLSFQ